MVSFVLQLLKLSLGEFCSLTGECQNIRKVGKVVVRNTEANLELIFASTCGNCTNPAFKFDLCDPTHWLNLIAEPNIKESEEDESLKLSVIAAGNLEFSITGVWTRL